MYIIRFVILGMDKAKQALNTTYGLIAKSFAPKSARLYDKIPYVAIILFILAIVLKTIQKNSNNQNYLQNIVLGTSTGANQKQKNDPISALFLYYLDTMGVNSFFNSPENSIVAGIIMLLINYPLLMMIEMNIGHAYLAYFILVLILYQPFAFLYQKLVCYNSTNANVGLDDSPYCCGSFIFWATIGCFMAILLSCTNGWMLKSIILFIIVLTWGGIILYEYFGTYADETNDDKRTCKSFYWHGMNFAFGVLSGLVMAKC